MEAFRVVEAAIADAQTRAGSHEAMSPGARIGFVGLGAMGAPISEAIAAGGHALTVHDRDAASTRGRRGGRRRRRAPSARAVADAAEVVFVSLPTPDVVREVACGEDGLAGGGAMRTYVDLSTTGAVVAAEVAASLAARGVDVLDAPVSGGVAGAEGTHAGGHRRRRAAGVRAHAAAAGAVRRERLPRRGGPGTGPDRQAAEQPALGDGDDDHVRGA